MNKKLRVTEFTAKGINGLKLGQQGEAELEYEIIEKTKSYTVLQIKSINIKHEARRT